MNSVLNSSEVVRHFGEVLARVKHAGESFVVTKSDKPVALVVPVSAKRFSTGAEITKALASLPYDPDFADDLERVNKMDRNPENPWA